MGTPVCPYLKFSGTFANSGGHISSIQFLPFKLNTVFSQFQEDSVRFSLNLRLNDDSFDIGRGIGDSEVVSAIAVVFN